MIEYAAQTQVLTNNYLLISYVITRAAMKVRPDAYHWQCIKAFAKCQTGPIK